MASLRSRFGVKRKSDGWAAGEGGPVVVSPARSRGVDAGTIDPCWLALLLLLVMALGLPGCGTPEFQSRWLDREIVIDGDPREWSGAVYSVDGEMTVIGLQNDSTDLYLCVVSSDPNVSRQVLGRGMTLWLDAKGGRGKSFGIRFPLGAGEAGAIGHPDGSDSSSAARRSPDGPDSIPRAPWRRGGQESRSAALLKALRDSTADLELLSADGKAIRMRAAQATGIAVKLGLKDDVLTYEARIPLIKDERHPFAIGADFGRPIGLGLQTPDFKYSVFGRDGERGEPDGGPDRRSGDSSWNPSGDPSSGPSDDPSDGSAGGQRGRNREGGRTGDTRGSGRGPGSKGPVQFWLLARLAVNGAHSSAVPAQP